MATAGPRYPGTAASYANAGTSENAEAWVNPSNIGADDTSEAVITAATYDSPDISQILVGSNFGFGADIPAGSTINGITVEIMRRNSAGAASDNRVQLGTAANFAGLVGDNKADTALDWPTTEALKTYGGASDTWAAGIDATEIAATGFSVHLSVQADAANTDIQVDFIRVTVDYTPPAPSGSGAITVPPATVAGSGELLLTATGSISVPSATVAGAGAEVFTATGAVAVPAPMVAGSGAEVFTATGAVGVPAATVAGTGDHTGGGPEPITGTGAIAVPAPTVAGSGLEIITGSGAVAVPAAIVAGTGSLILMSTGAIQIPAAVVSAAGLHSVSVTGSGAITAPSAAIAGVGLSSGAVQYGKLRLADGTWVTFVLSD